MIWRQTDPRFPWPFHKWGCHVVTLGKMVSEVTRTDLLLEDYLFSVIAMQATPKGNGFVLDRELTVNGPDELLRIFIERVAFQHRLRIYQVGADGEYWKWVKLKRVDWTVLKGETANGNYHFRLGNENARETYNPDPGVRIAKELSIIYYQVSWL